jgi:hypothetical protein
MKKRINTRQKWANFYGLVGGFVAWYGLVDLANNAGIKHAAFEVVFGFATLITAIVAWVTNYGKTDSDLN